MKLRHRLAARIHRAADFLDLVEVPDPLTSSRLAELASRVRDVASVLAPPASPWSCVACGGDPRECGWCATEDDADADVDEELVETDAQVIARLTAALATERARVEQLTSSLSHERAVGRLRMQQVEAFDDERARWVLERMEKGL